MHEYVKHADVPCVLHAFLRDHYAI